MPSHTPEEQARNLERNRANPRAQRRGRIRAALGNQRIADAAQAVREAPARIASRVRGAFGGGVAEPTTTRVRAAQESVRARGPGGIEVTQDRPAGTRGAGGLRRVAGGAAGGLVGGAIQAGRLQQVATGAIGRLPALVARTNPATAGVATLLDKSLRRARGETALESVVEPAISGISAATGGLVPEGLAPGAQDSPLNFGGPTPIELGRQALRIEEPGAQAPQVQQPGGLREFTGADIGGGAANRGTASVEENQQVLDRLLAEREQRGEGQPAAGGLRGFAGQQGQPGQQADPTATRLAQQAGAGGIASAFGALALSGNQLRREAAGRSRAAAAAQGLTEQQQQADLNLRNKLTEIGAKSQVDRAESFGADSLAVAESVNDALESRDPQQIGVITSTVLEQLKQAPEGPARGAAASLIANDIRANTETGLFAAFFSFLPEFLGGTGRGPLDVFAAAGQGGFNNEFQNALDKMTFNESTGELQIATPSGTGDLQDVTKVSNLKPEVRELLTQLGVRTVGAGQPETRGDPNRLNPRRPSLRSGR